MPSAIFAPLHEVMLITCSISRKDFILTNYESCRRAWEKLESGEIAYSSKECQGHCHENIANFDLNYFSLHDKLRTMDFCQKKFISSGCWSKSWS